jgi:hypothetical protein
MIQSRWKPACLLLLGSRVRSSGQSCGAATWPLPRQCAPRAYPYSTLGSGPLLPEPRLSDGTSPASPGRGRNPTRRPPAVSPRAPLRKRRRTLLAMPMPKRKPFPPEPSTRPDLGRAKVIGDRHSGRAPRSLRERSTLSTLPPPPAESGTPASQGSAPPWAAEPTSKPTSKERAKLASKERPSERDLASATVDEVTADLRRDGRHEREE